MKTYLCSKKKSLIILILLFIIFISTSSFSNWSNQTTANTIMCNSDDYSLYPGAIKEMLATFNIDQSESKPYYILNDGGITEAFDTQAIGALEAGIAKYWYPQYLATVVIGVDRDQTDIQVTSWDDLFAAQEEVGISDTPENLQMLTAAMSYGLEGENYTLTKTIQVLSSLYDNNHLKVNSFESPIIICYDYQAASLIEEGRNIEIIIPEDGTYTYEKGLLSNEKLNFQGDVDKLLIGANLRLLDGQGNPALYPDEIQYRPGIRVNDYEYFAKFTENVESKIERRVFDSRLYMSIDNREHIFFALIYIIVVTIWEAALLHRTIQKGVSYAAFFTGIVLIGWILVRLIKYQVEAIPTLGRYLWYSFYIFQLSLPLVLLWMAWAIDKPENQIFPPKWWRMIGILVGILIIFVFTNDLHGFVLDLDLTRPDWGSNYSYGFGYYIILFVCGINLFTFFAILVQKSIKNARKKSFIFPIGIFVLFIIYNYKYITRDPFVYQTDLTIITGVFTMLMFESCIWSGLIPVNTKYIDIFTRSPLKMQIINKDSVVEIASTSSRPLDKELLDKLIASSPMPLWQDNFLIFANPIPGGYAVWEEDVSKLYQLNREVQESTQMLIEANAILAEEEKIKRTISHRSVKKDLMDQLEGEIAESLKLLSAMIEKLPRSENHPRETTSIALLLCYIKRRCNFFFQEKEKETIDINELILYIDELSEITHYYNVQIVTLNEIKGQLPIRYATLFYDFSYLMADLAVNKKLSYSIQNIEIKDEFFKMGFLASKDLGGFQIDTRFVAAIEGVKGKITIKKLEDTIGISISFPKGGGRYD